MLSLSNAKLCVDWNCMRFSRLLLFCVRLGEEERERKSDDENLRQLECV